MTPTPEYSGMEDPNESMEQQADRLHPTSEDMRQAAERDQTDAEERHMRAHALQLAADTRDSNNADEMVQRAAQFYAFLSGTKATTP